MRVGPSRPREDEDEEQGGQHQHQPADGTGNQRYCFIYQPGVEAPTLRVNPGDVLSLQLTNRLDLPGDLHSHRMPVANPCANATMGADSTNVHFHGLNVPPICHQDDVLRTMINPGDPPFRYSVRIPTNEPPGLYWYHPHPHGFTQVQVMGGASGAIIVEGIEKLKPEVVGLPQRVLIVRDQLLPGGGDPDASNLTLNFVGTAHPANLEMQAGKKEFWRFLNASAENFLTLQFKVTDVPQDMKVISLDGTP